MMRTVLNFLLVLQAIIGLFATFQYATAGDAGLAGFSIAIVFIPIQMLLLLFVGVVAWRYPACRRKALLVALLPLAFILLAGMLRPAASQPVHVVFFLRLGAAVAAFGLVLTFIFPRRVATRLPTWFFRSRLVNTLPLILLAMAWLIPLGWLAMTGADVVAEINRDRSGYKAGYLLIAGGVYVLLLSVASLLVFSWGSLGLRGGVAGARRKLHATQLVIAVPGVLAGIGVWLWMAAIR